MKTLGNPSKEDICGFVTTTAYKQLERENAKLKKKLQGYFYLTYKAAKEKGNILTEMMIRDEAKEFGINLD